MPTYLYESKGRTFVLGLIYSQSPILYENGLYWLAGNALGTNVRLLISEKCEMSMFFSGLFAILTIIRPKTTWSF